ncbi:hypothetical protein [Streptomonospora litoralis]|uniref:Uncharacterized protein n=1 Tax=Streptomonospora litoralis TaxID=2498135 RepID=A0A4P6PYV5_9ACTN|nr:hypothetical protein [Streptomonospora litoralis]QBI53486.1 hypothetical protein EKD16_08460 [Streptomonospora litoralis]
MGGQSYSARRVVCALWGLAAVIVGVEIAVENPYTAGILAVAGTAVGAAAAGSVMARGQRRAQTAARWAHQTGWREGFVAGTEAQLARDIERARHDV